ncbi:MAG: hypothetical protein A2Y74_08695 [Actinobacteria bacterium RBG_13_63_9]|nr:MAG: hypothetical protein A2Y74_08695 [Actinobacteria bacterium RBG_13_63_9]
MALDEAKLSQHAVETRKSVLDAGLDAFFEHGFEGSTIRDIARRVSLNSASLYYYFPSKHAILHGIMLSAMNDLLAEAKQAMEEAVPSAVSRLSAVLLTHIHFHGTRRKEAIITEFELRLITPERRQEVAQLRDEYEDILRQLVHQGIHEGAFRCVDVDLAVRAMIWSCSSVAQWYRPDGPLSLPEIARYYADLWITALLGADLPPVVLTEKP